MKDTQDEKIPAVLKVNPDELVFDMRVAGTTFIPDSEELLKLLKSVSQDKLNLVLSREPDNKYDPNAVRVSVKVEGFDKSRFVGYIPKDYSELVSYVILHRDKYKLLVTRPTLCGGVEGKEYIGIFFGMKIQRLETYF